MSNQEDFDRLMRHLRWALEEMDEPDGPDLSFLRRILQRSYKQGFQLQIGLIEQELRKGVTST